MAFGKTDKIDVLYPATVGKTLKLKPGNYKIDVINNKKLPAVKFYNNSGKLVGQAPAKVVNESSKNSNTQVDYSTLASNTHAITEISLRGWKEDLYFHIRRPTRRFNKPCGSWSRISAVGFRDRIPSVRRVVAPGSSKGSRSSGLTILDDANEQFVGGVSSSVIIGMLDFSGADFFPDVAARPAFQVNAL